eukprot:809073-Lingulodinium_polyedra.AAC.1
MTRVGMVLARERWVWDFGVIDERSSAARGVGWKSLRAPAQKMKVKRGPGGCCIFVREVWGLCE